MRGQGAAGDGRGARGGGGAIATVEDAGGRTAGCASEVGEFDDDGRGAGDAGWSREAREKVNATAARRTWSRVHAESMTCVQVRQLLLAAVVTLKSKFSGATVARD